MTIMHVLPDGKSWRNSQVSVASIQSADMLGLAELSDAVNVVCHDLEKRTTTHLEKSPFCADLKSPRSPILIERGIEESSVIVSAKTLVQVTVA